MSQPRGMRKIDKIVPRHEGSKLRRTRTLAMQAHVSGLPPTPRSAEKSKVASWSIYGHAYGVRLGPLVALLFFLWLDVVRCGGAMGGKPWLPARSSLTRQFSVIADNVCTCLTWA